VSRGARAAILAGAAVLALVVAGIVLVSGGSGEQRRHHALIPAYMRPDGLERLARHDGDGSVMIVNPSNGPGAQAEPAYQDAIRTAQRSGWKVIGYVHTSYGGRPAADVEADARRYADWYRVDGIFLDEASHTRDQLPYYRALRERIGGLLVLNPGIPPDPGYADAADVIVTYEGAFADADGRLRAPSWLPAERAAALVYAAPERDALALIDRHGAGYLYVTSGTLPDPWSVPPPYIDRELR
jgi:Spherulation-specific family 4